MIRSAIGLTILKLQESRAGRQPVQDWLDRQNERSSADPAYNQAAQGGVGSGRVFHSR
jgi:hypothetical protein